jgi:hypothetical protein
MRKRPIGIPALYVEGADDISAISGLLKRYDLDTERGKKHLFIRHSGNDAIGSTGSDSELFAELPDRVRENPETPCGFVFDIDIEATTRWARVKQRLESLQASPFRLQFENPLPTGCDTDGLPGFVGKVKGYAHPFGIWLMPDCKTDGQKLEHLIETLIRKDDPILKFAKESTAKVPAIVEEANQLILPPTITFSTFAPKDRINAELRAWLAWQEEPGQPFGAAITNKSLCYDSPEALAFLRWLSRLYGFHFDAVSE